MKTNHQLISCNPANQIDLVDYLAFLGHQPRSLPMMANYQNGSSYRGRYFTGKKYAQQIHTGTEKYIDEHKLYYSHKNLNSWMQVLQKRSKMKYSPKTEISSKKRFYNFYVA